MCNIRFYEALRLHDSYGAKITKNQTPPGMFCFKFLKDGLVKEVQGAVSKRPGNVCYILTALGSP